MKIAVETDFDRVVLTLGKTSIQIPYATSLQIAAHLKMACTQAMRVSGELIANRDQYAEDIVINPVHSSRRLSPLRDFEWRIDIDFEKVYLVLGDHLLESHFSEGLKIAHWLRLAGKQAKNAVGDKSLGLTVTGVLSDAETNYRYGYQ